MSYLIRTPLFSYLAGYFNDSSGFRESRITSMNKAAARELESCLREDMPLVRDLEIKGHDTRNITLGGSFDELQPFHVQIEVTDNCNLFCDYCYRDSNYKDPNSKYIDFRVIRDFLLRERERSLLEVGVTGGEPTMHPNFQNIMEIILENFELCELVTNGTNYRQVLEAVNHAGENARKLNLSVSFNRWERDFDLFKQGNHYLNGFLQNVAGEHPVRMILTDATYDAEKAREAEKKLRDVGVKEIDFSFVSPIGRGKSKMDELGHLSIFPGADEQEGAFTPTPLNCGLVFKHTVIGPDGNLRPCALFPLTYSTGTMDELSSKKNRTLWTLPSPSEEICSPCDYEKYCRGCIYKGLFNSNRDCSYRKFIGEKYGSDFLPHVSGK